MIKFLLEHADRPAVSFHMPGHKGSALYRRYGYGEWLDKFMDCDITEIPGADNLFQTEGVLKDIQDRYAALYDVKNSYLLVNGTSGGLIAAVLAAVQAGKKLIMAKNCHKSIFNALTLGHIDPVYAHPLIDDEYGITGAVEPSEIEQLLRENPEAEAVILPSPNYYGICSDIRSIAEVTHRAGRVLIVDQAHGAHLHFFHKFGAGKGMPLSAEAGGADITVGSTHKTLASLTQSAVLNLCSDRVDRYALEDKLQAVESTSPSYVLMASLDINAELLEQHGPVLMNEWRINIDWFYEQAKNIPAMKIMTADMMDITKINIDMSAYGISGAELERSLREKDIFTELNTGDILMCMTGIGSSREDLGRLLSALNETAQNHETVSQAEKKTRIKLPASGRMHPVPGHKEPVPLEEAAGRICAYSIIPYPPGAPLVCPGEEISEETVRYIRSLREAGSNVIGVNDKGQIMVGK
mgnify:CR=1 FL=1